MPPSKLHGCSASGRRYVHSLHPNVGHGRLAAFHRIRTGTSYRPRRLFSASAAPKPVGNRQNMCLGFLFAIPAAVVAFVAGYLCPRHDSALLELALSRGADSFPSGSAALTEAVGHLSAPAVLIAQSLGWAGAVLAVLTVGAAATVGVLFTLLKADADIGLLLRGKHKPDAFSGKVIWITGASQGLGEILAKYLAAQGAKLILSSRSEEKLQRAKAACKTDASNIVILPFDLLDPTSRIEAAAAAADAAFGGAGVDYMINNAGASQHALASETTDDVATQLMDLNAMAPIRLTRAMLPYLLKRRKGRIVVIASMAAKIPSPGQAVYSAAKMALWGYFGSLATEVADKGVSVTIICPGPVTGPADAPRVLYGPKGLIQRIEPQDKKRMDSARAAVLIANAMAAGVTECWLAKQPVLTLAYLMQYVPQLAWLILKKVGPARAKALASGRSGYDVRSFASGNRSS